MAHTPGPWTFAKNFNAGSSMDYWVRSPSGIGICELALNAKAQDNARLIASAPKLLSALKTAEDFISGFEDDELQENIGSILKEIREAIQQAE